MIGSQIKQRLTELDPSLIQEKVLENFDQIELDEEDLRKAREAKFYRLKQQDYLKSIQERTAGKRFSAEAYYQAFTDIFPIDEKKEERYMVIVKRLCCYFAGDTRFNTTDLNLDKGILLFGGVGVGKTTLMQMFAQNQAFSYRIVSCRQVGADFIKDGEDALSRYSSNYDIPVNSNPYGHQVIGYCFDDLGTERSDIKHYGNSKNVMTDILLNRYDSKLDPRSTHITTNLSAEEIEATYGTRVIDRIRERFNLITFDNGAKSRR
jgi:DNA replication protein DnaC